MCNYIHTYIILMFQHSWNLIILHFKYITHVTEYRSTGSHDYEQNKGVDEANISDNKTVKAKSQKNRGIIGRADIYTDAADSSGGILNNYNTFITYECMFRSGTPLPWTPYWPPPNAAVHKIYQRTVFGPLLTLSPATALASLKS